MVEQVPYRVVRKYPGCEIRDYAEHNLVSTDVAGNLESSSNTAFRPLFGYISGDNAAAQKVSMTAPVLQEQTAPNTHRISFAMPSALTIDSIPAPNNTQLKVSHVPRHVAAAMQFRGSWSEDRVNGKASELLAQMSELGLEVEGPVLFARYNPPFYPPMLRRNEVLVRLADSDINRKILGL